MLQFFLKRKNLFFLILLFVFSLSLFARNIEKRNDYNFFDKLILGLLSPPLKFTNYTINSVYQLWENYFFLVNLKKENTSLKEHVKTLETEKQLHGEYVSENKRLRELLSFKKKLSYKILPAEIIGRDPSSWFKTILIDKGKKTGVVRGSGIITPKGIVGKVINVSNDTSKVLLVSDINSSVDAVIKRSRARGIVEGYRENSCKLSYVLKSEDIITGDVILSSGLHSIYPPGIVIGAVSSTAKDLHGFFHFIKVAPAVDFSKLNEVLIVLKEK